MGINLLDSAVAVVAALLVARGIWVGFIRQLAFFFALFLGYGAAGQFYGQLSPYVTPVVSNPQLAFLVTYFMLFVTAYFLAMTAGSLLRKVMQISFLGWFDRLLGGMFGLIKATFVCTLLFMLLTALTSTSTPLIEKSFTAPHLSNSSQLVVGMVRDKDLRTKLLPKEQAISSFFSESIPMLQALGGNAKQVGKDNEQVPESSARHPKPLPAPGGSNRHP